MADFYQVRKTHCPYETRLKRCDPSEKVSFRLLPKKKFFYKMILPLRNVGVYTATHSRVEIRSIIDFLQDPLLHIGCGVRRNERGVISTTWSWGGQLFERRFGPPETKPGAEHEAREEAGKGALKQSKWNLKFSSAIWQSTKLTECSFPNIGAIISANIATNISYNLCVVFRRNFTIVLHIFWHKPFFVQISK